MQKKNIEKTEVKKVSDHETVKIGSKPAINYLLATATLFAQGAKSVTLKARGKSIITAVNVEEGIKRRISLKKPAITLKTEMLQDHKTKKAVRVSAIDILLEPK